MKKLIFAFILGTIALVSCSKTPTNTETVTTNDTVVTDTVPNDTVPTDTVVK